MVKQIETDGQCIILETDDWKERGGASKRFEKKSEETKSLLKDEKSAESDLGVQKSRKELTQNGRAQTHVAKGRFGSTEEQGIDS